MAECNRVDDSFEAAQGGYCDVGFIDPPDSLQCPVCLSTLTYYHVVVNICMR